jgi:D-cysteine desulfhydrase
MTDKRRRRVMFIEMLCRAIRLIALHFRRQSIMEFSQFPEKIKLAHLPTPIESYRVDGRTILIKRDDLTGAETTGNKIRKMEYLLYEAQKQNADTLITCGGEQSNHARTVAAVAARCGMKCVLVLWGSPRKSMQGNLLIDKFLGADIRFVDRKTFDRSTEVMEEIAARLRKRGRRPYIIPEGGSSALGIWGYIEAAREIKNQLIERNESVDYIVTAFGTGGTVAGLAIGKKLFGLDATIIGVNVLYDAKTSLEKVLQLTKKAIQQYSLGIEVGPDDFGILDGYSKEGYKKIEMKKLRYLASVARQTGIIFDPTYTGKAFYGILDRLKRRSDLTGARVLFIHTGGIFSIFAKAHSYSRP